MLQPFSKVLLHIFLNLNNLFLHWREPNPFLNIMEEVINENNENQERRDYASGDEAHAGYSSEGRKLRHRRKVTAEKVSDQAMESSYEPRGNYGERRPRPSYGERRSASGEDSFGYRGSRPSYNRDDHYSQHRSYGSNRSYGDRPAPRRNYGPRQEDGYDGGGQRYGNRSTYSSNRPSYGQRRSYNDNGYSRRPSQDGENGERRQYVRKPYSQNRGYGANRTANHFSKPGRPAGRRPSRRNEPYFTATDEAGINQMLSTKPQVSDSAELSDNDIVQTPIKEEIRLNKYIANSGICSRREADNFIQAGVVTVNGEVVTELGTKVNVLKDEVKFNGELLKGEPKVYIVMNKPKGFVTSASDPHAEKTVMDLLKGCKTRVFPVGRLDKNTTGVLMFTNDGEIAEQLTHPQYNKKKIYQVILDKPLEEADKDKIVNEGIDLSDGNVKADELEYIDADDHRRLGIEIHSGKNRIVRRIFETLGYEVKALDRVYFAGLTKKGLKKGEWRYLSEGEVNILKMGAYV
jgi:23S rRNA pseudouridine2605 synthase